MSEYEKEGISEENSGRVSCGIVSGYLSLLCHGNRRPGCIEDDPGKKDGKDRKAAGEKGSSKQAALKALFKYTERKFGYARTVGFKAASGWGKTYALEMFQKKKGSCYHFAAAYAYLAKEATGLPVRLCIGQTNGFNASRWQQHAWVEIKISGKWYIYDPNMDKFAADSSLKYYKKSRDKLYGVTYKVSKRYTVKY